MLTKNINKKCLLAFGIAALGLTGCGSDSHEAARPSVASATNHSYQAADFVSRTRLRLRSVPVGGEPARELDLPEDTELSLLETKQDPEHGLLARLGLDVGDESDLPSDIWVVLTPELSAGLLQISPPADTESEFTGASGSLGLTAIQVARRGMTYCYRYVKRYLLSTGQVRGYLPGSSAHQAAAVLPRHGFRRTASTPATARNGEVCVYRGGPQGHGHIEVKRNNRWWFGYGYNSSPIQGRQFIGCYAK